MVTFELSPPNMLMYFWTHCSATRSGRDSLHYYVQESQSSTFLRSTKPAFPIPACCTSWLARKPHAVCPWVSLRSRIPVRHDCTRDSKIGNSSICPKNHVILTLNSPVVHCDVDDGLSKRHRYIDNPHPLPIVTKKTCLKRTDIIVWAHLCAFPLSNPPPNIH